MLKDRVANSVPKFEQRKKPCVLKGFRQESSILCFNKCGKNSQFGEYMRRQANHSHRKKLPKN